MLITEFDFEMKYENDQLNANCSVTFYFKKPVYRVFIKGGKMKRGMVFIFFRMEEKNFFWFQIPNSRKQHLATAVAKQLETFETPALLKDAK